MLRQLVINNLAVIDKLDLEFDAGMTVFTGETGAGKSILLDAIGLILGDRADTSFIRGGADKADITAVFSLNNLPDVRTLLDELEIDCDDELFIRRVVSNDGRSRAYINGQPVPVQALRDLGIYLVDIFGQHAHQSLSHTKMQRQLLDEFGEYQDCLARVGKLYHEWKDINQQLQQIETGGEDYEARLTLLRYQIEELNELEMADSEYASLDEKQKRLAHSQQLLEACQTAISELKESDAAIDDRIRLYQRKFEDLTRLDASLKNIAEILNNACIQIDEAAAELRDYIDHIDNDNSALNEVEKRLDRYHDLARKHRVKPETLVAHLQALQRELDKLEHGQGHRDELLARQQQVSNEYFEQASTLLKHRQTAAKQIAQSVTEKMHELGMGGEFTIEVAAIDDATPRLQGMDTVNFLVSTNPGQPSRPLGKVASGGELSRLSLAIQIIGSSDSGVPTLIFDEVDTGISGGIAEVVGRLLHSLAKQRQIFCVTHLAQVASCGNQHFRVSKDTRGKQTFTSVEVLDRAQRIDEVARMLAGLTITTESRANAEKMLEAV